VAVGGAWHPLFLFFQSSLFSLSSHRDSCCFARK
jgi:hypothetical protein